MYIVQYYTTPHIYAPYQSIMMSHWRRRLEGSSWRLCIVCNTSVGDEWGCEKGYYYAAVHLQLPGSIFHGYRRHSSALQPRDHIMVINKRWWGWGEAGQKRRWGWIINIFFSATWYTIYNWLTTLATNSNVDEIYVATIVVVEGVKNKTIYPRHIVRRPALLFRAAQG